MSDFDLDPSLAPTPDPTPEPLPAAEPEPVPDLVADPEPALPADAEPEPAAPVVPNPKHRGAVAELIEKRAEAKREREGRIALEGRLEQIERDLSEGRLLRQAPTPQVDVDRARAMQTAETLNLYTQDAQGNRVPDLEAAARVDTWGRQIVSEAVAPVRAMTLRDKAMANVSAAIQFAEANGFDVETVKDTYGEILRQPNGAELLSQAEVATTVWHQAVGRAVTAGKLPKAKAAPVAAPVPAAKPAAIITEAPGRRGPAAAIRLSPALERVYRDHGLDPTAATKAFETDKNGDIILE